MLEDYDQRIMQANDSLSQVLDNPANIPLR